MQGTVEINGDSFLNGKGAIMFSNGDKFEGDFTNGLVLGDGYGRIEP